MIFVIMFKIKLIVTLFFLRLAGVMAELIEENEPTPLRKFSLNVQWGIRYIIRATPLLCAHKCEYLHSLDLKFHLQNKVQNKLMYP